MFDFVLAIFLLLSPIILLPSIGNITALQFYQFGIIDSSNSYLQLQFFQFGIIALFIVSLFQKKVRELNDKWLVIFIASCLISCLIHPISIKVFSNIFLGFLLYKLTYEYTQRIRLLLFTIVIVSMLNFIFQMLQSFGINFIYSYAGLITKSFRHILCSIYTYMLYVQSLACNNSDYRAFTYKNMDSHICSNFNYMFKIQEENF